MWTCVCAKMFARGTANSSFFRIMHNQFPPTGATFSLQTAKKKKKTMLCFPFKLEVIPNFRPHREWENKWDMFARVRLQAVSSASDDSGALVVGYRKTRQYRWARCCVREVKLSPVMRDSKSNQRLRSKLCCNQQHPHKHTHTEQSWCCAREITYLGKHMLNVN